MKPFRILISLRTQLILAYFFLFLMSFLFFAFYLFKQVENELNTRMRDDLVQQGTFIANLFTHSMLEHRLTTGQRKLIVVEIKRSSLKTGSWIGIVNQKAFILENTGMLEHRWVGDRPEIRDALRGNESTAFRKESSGNTIYVAVPVLLNGIVEGAIYLSKPLKANEAFFLSLRHSLIKAGGVVFAVAMIFVFLIANLLTVSIRKITRAVRRMERGAWQGPVTRLPPNEIGLLGQAFNEMAGSHQQLEKLRAQFVSDVSHELKTPLSSIKAICEVLREEALKEPAQAKKFLQSMEEEVDRLSRLVKDLLDLSKLESGIFPLHKEEIVLEELLRETVSKFPDSQIKVSLPEGKTAIMADPDRIRQVIYNLLDNALRAVAGTTDPRIEASIQEWQGKIAIRVKDNGIGISSEDLPRIFERFYRVDRSRTRKDGGTGLGLAIVKQIIEAHGGGIWAESSLREGSTFTFVLPA